MTYELAKELKDAGFPQAADSKGTLRKGGEYLFPEGLSLSTSKKNFDAAVAYAPTLSELIEACGANFYDLRRAQNGHGKEWNASNCAVTPVDAQTVTVGSTPEEAVARLWLVLNKK